METNKSAISNILLENVLAEWNTIAFFAFNEFVQNGRGVVALEKNLDGENSDIPLTAMYAVYDFENGKPDNRVAHMIQNYNPEKEFIVQFIQESNDLRTIRIKTAQGGFTPRRLWAMKCLEKIDENEMSMNDFLDICENLNSSRFGE